MYSTSSPDNDYTTKVDKIIGENTDLTRDLENWMTKLPTSLRSVPIIYLAIPGSHDSFTSVITRYCDISLDTEKILRKLKWIFCIKSIMANWTKTQNFDSNEQLKAGIRYFDLRISTKKCDNCLYFCHGLYCGKVENVLQEISSFLENHPKEIVILDCQHFYGFTQETHGKLMHMLIEIYGTRLLPYSDHMDHLSLDYMTNHFRYQVMVIYRSDAARFGQPLLWPSTSFPTPWPNTMNPNSLFNRLDNSIQVRSEDIGLITQCLLTPKLSDIIEHMFTTLKQKLAIDFEDLRTGWISKQIPGKGGVNVIIGDYIDLSDCLFTKTVINLNLKLLPDLPKPFSIVTKLID